MRGGSFALLAVGSERFANSLCASAASALSESGDGFQISCDVGSATLPVEASVPREGLELAARRAAKKRAVGGFVLTEQQVVRFPLDHLAWLQAKRLPPGPHQRPGGSPVLSVAWM